MYRKETFPQHLRQLRKSQGATQHKLAKKLGVSAASISTWEQGKTFPNLEILDCIADYFGKSLDWLVGRQDAAEESDIAQSSTYIPAKKIKDDLSEASGQSV